MISARRLSSELLLRDELHYQVRGSRSLKRLNRLCVSQPLLGCKKVAPEGADPTTLDVLRGIAERGMRLLAMRRRQWLPPDRGRRGGLKISAHEVPQNNTLR
jgi:hypothetical protein